ncbi:MAG TPA: sugar MFS transporter [Candidatus Saccharimonadales bacterium]|nr:sugar MFS transporter [Candidatus Saccharimonadales bacterium]
MTPTSLSTQTNGKGGGLFRLPDGRNLFVTFALVTSLFLLWGFCNGMIDILNKHFQDSLHINKEQSGLVQFANYLAYFLMAIPAGLIARKFGYKGGIIVGLVLIATGAFWFIPATNIGAYWAFLLGLFVIASGMTCLETIANPYTTVLGPPESGATRINIAQTFNGVGWILGPIVGGHFVFAGKDGVNANAGLSTPYLGIGIFAAVWILVFIIAPMPDLHAKDESKKSADQKTTLRPSAGQYMAIGIILLVACVLLYFFISPILRDLWGLFNLDQGTLPPAIIGILILLFSAAFILVAKNWDLFRRKHFTLGIATQFFYVAAQTGIFGFFVNYVLENDPNVTRMQASTWLGAIGFVLFAFGRLCGSALISQLKPYRVLATYAVINVALTAITMGGGKLGLFALCGTFFFMSVMFPTIFALGIRGIGEHTKLGSSLIVMSIVGGAIAPPFMGHIADSHSMRVGFVVPLVCFAFIAIYGAAWQKLEYQDRSI